MDGWNNIHWSTSLSSPATFIHCKPLLQVFPFCKLIRLYGNYSNSIRMTKGMELMLIYHHLIIFASAHQHSLVNPIKRSERAKDWEVNYAVKINKYTQFKQFRTPSARALCFGQLHAICNENSARISQSIIQEIPILLQLVFREIRFHFADIMNAKFSPATCERNPSVEELGTCIGWKWEAKRTNCSLWHLYLLLLYMYS